MDSTHSTLEALAQKLQDLEIKIAFHEDTIERLSDVIAKQDKELSDLWAANKILKQSVNEMKAGHDADGPEPPPPHY